MARRGAEFSMLGLGDFDRDLDALRDDVRLRLEDALDDSARNVQQKARIFVPRDRNDLARAISVGGRGLSRLVGINDEDVPSRGGRNTAHRNPWVYGVWYEFGFKTRNIDKHSFMGPAVDAEESAHNARIDRALDGALKP